MTEGRRIARYPKYAFMADGTVLSKHLGWIAMKPIRCGAYRGLTLTTSAGVQSREYVHRLIAEAFHGVATDGMVCRHLDGNRFNNAADNLSWGTPSENNLDMRQHGTSPTGERNPRAKLTENAVQDMRLHRKATGESFAKIGARFGVSTMTAHRAITGVSWAN
jgi:hypothetical protein